MSKLFNDTMQGLLEAVAIDRGEMPLVEREDMPAKTMFSAELKEKVWIKHPGTRKIMVFQIYYPPS